MLTQTELKSIFHYDPETGLFTRIVKTTNSVKVGDVAVSNRGDGYIQIKINKKDYLAHRLAWLYMTGWFPKREGDHINGGKDDNRWCNLRDVTRLVNNQNLRNLKRDNTSGYAGVSWQKSANKWKAQIGVNNKNIYLGLFIDKHEAGAYRLAKKRELHEGCTI